MIFQGEAVNQAACDLAREVADEGGALVAGNICQVPTYLDGKGKEACQAEYKKQIDVFVKNNVDFLIGEVRCRHLNPVYVK
jgi:betaine-homocysteine S-methyltransferase